MRGLQNPQPVPGGKADDVFFATRQVTRHYIAYHGASPDIEGEILPGARTFRTAQPWGAIGSLERFSCDRLQCLHLLRHQSLSIRQLLSNVWRISAT